jgi:hypothetical protein
MQTAEEYSTHKAEKSVGSGNRRLSQDARADPREWPRLRTDRLRTPPRFDPIDTEEEIARWRRRDRIERIIGVAAVTIAAAIPLAILGLVAYALAKKLRPEEGWNSGSLPMAFLFGGAVLLLLVIVLVFDALSARSTRRKLQSDRSGELPPNEHGWGKSTADVEGESESMPDVPAIERIKLSLSKIGKARTRY